MIDCYLSISLVNGILCIPRILKLDKAEALWLSGLRVVDKLQGKNALQRIKETSALPVELQ